MQEFRPTRLQALPPVVKNLMILNVLVFLAQESLPNVGLNIKNLFSLHTWQSQQFKPWQIITHGFINDSFIGLFFTCLGLWFLATLLENLWGTYRFLVFYFACLLFSSLVMLTTSYFIMNGYIDTYNTLNAFQQSSVDVNFREALDFSLNGPQAALSGCFAAFAYLFPNTQIYLYFIVPVKIKWAFGFSVALTLWSAFASISVTKALPIGYLAAMAMGFMLVWFWNRNNRQRFY